MSSHHDDRESSSSPSTLAVPSRVTELSQTDSDDVVLFDTAKLRQAAHKAFRALRRYPFSAAMAALLVLAGGSVSWLAAPLTYQSTGVVSARSDVVSSSIANPGRAVPSGSDQPLANARETILSESSIDRIIDDVELLDRTRAGETVLGRFRRETLASLGLQTESSQKHEDLRRALRRALFVQIDGGSNGPDRVTITAYWTNARDAAAIVTAAQANFLEDRHDASLGPIEDALQILQRYAAEADAEVARLREELNFPQTETRDIPDASPLRAALGQQADLSERLNGAQIELDAAEAAFKYRYTVVETPEEPVAPTSSLVKRIAITLFMAIGAGVAAATGRAAVRQKRTQRSARRTRRPRDTTQPRRGRRRSTESNTETPTPSQPAGVDAHVDSEPLSTDTERANPTAAPGSEADEDLVALRALLEEAESAIGAIASAPTHGSDRPQRRQDDTL